jgi:hypothetical protein
MLNERSRLVVHRGMVSPRPPAAAFSQAAISLGEATYIRGSSLMVVPLNSTKQYTVIGECLLSQDSAAP